MAPTANIAPTTELSATLRLKYERLGELLAAPLARGLIIAYSGGVDSAFLLWAAEQARRAHGGRLLAITTVSQSLAQVERDDAQRFAELVGVEHRWENSDELSNPDYARNDLTRCYHCKTELFRISRALATELGFEFIAYGYNASDRGDFRPGQKAAVENEILAPLSDAELTKDEIRALMRAFGLPLADKPASPCLSSRLMTGVAVTPEKLRDVEALEDILRGHGVSVFRMRLHEQGGQRWLRLEVAPDEMARVLAIRSELTDASRARGYAWLTLDLAGYRMGGANAAGRPNQPTHERNGAA